MPGSDNTKTSYLFNDYHEMKRWLRDHGFVWNGHYHERSDGLTCTNKCFGTGHLVICSHPVPQSAQAAA